MVRLDVKIITVIYLLLLMVYPSYDCWAQKMFTVSGRLVNDRNEPMREPIPVTVKRRQGYEKLVMSTTDGRYSVPFPPGDKISITYGDTTYISSAIENISGQSSHTITKVIRLNDGRSKLTDSEASQFAAALAIYSSDREFYYKEIERFQGLIPEYRVPPKYRDFFQNFEKIAKATIVFCKDANTFSSNDTDCKPEL